MKRKGGPRASKATTDKEKDAKKTKKTTKKPLKKISMRSARNKRNGLSSVTTGAAKGPEKDSGAANIKFEINQEFQYQAYTEVPFERIKVDETLAKEKFRVLLPPSFLDSLNFSDIKANFGVGQF